MQAFAMQEQAVQVHLLVVDDDDVDRERVLRLLGRSTLKFVAMEAASGAMALRLLREHEFDCVMLDNQLGGDSGADLLPAIRRAARRDCPVIMITGAGNESLAVQALQDGAADYLTKYQLSADLLVRTIGRALEHHRMRAELDDLHRRLEQRVEQQAAAIRQSERDLRAILDHTPTVIGCWDAQLHNRFGNRAYRRWFSVEPERLPGRHLVDVIGSAQLERERPRIEAVLRGESQFYEQAFDASDGAGIRHAQVSLHPDVGDDGVVRGFYSNLHDVTPIKQAQARAEELAAFSDALFEHSPVGLGVFDGALQCVMANQALAQLAGTREQDLVGLALARLSPDDMLPLLATGRATLADGLPRRLALDLHTVFGAHLLADCAWARVDKDGQGHLLLAAQDSTDQRHAHEALVAARNAAEQATRAKSEFLANMSHEIRTPMNAIVGLSELALEDTLPPEARSFIEKAHHAALALMGILDDVLDYSKVEAGQLRIEHLPLDIEQVVQRSVDLFSARIGQKGLAFIVNLAPGLPRCVLGDPLRLSQVINNLLGNAVKFTERGRILLSVQALDGHAPAPDMVRFAVRDSGIGVAPAHREALFEAFAQGDGSITRRFGGTGLGLTICRRLVAMMHGSIGFQSEPGQGSEFWFTARLDRSPVALPADPAARLAGLRLLLIEPDAEVAQGLCQRLQSWQVQVQRAADTAQALVQLVQAQAAGQRIDVLLLALATPGGADGPAGPAGAQLQALRDAAGAGSPTVLIGMASATDRSAPAAGSAEPVPDQVLGKPVLPAALRGALLQVLARRQPAEWPAASTPAAWPARPGRPPGGTARRGRPLAGVRVLLVEDNETNRLVAEVFLQRLGATVVLAVDGAQALQRLQAGTEAAFDVVLMDLHMPVMDGLEATRRIRALPQLAALPVIGMTAAAMAEDRARCLAAGMADHVSKPIVVNQLLEVLMRWTGRQPPGLRSEANELDLPGFELSALHELLEGDTTMMRQMLRLFARHEAHTAAEVAALVACDQPEQACRRLHGLRGAAGTLGITAVARSALALEQALRGHQTVPAVQAPLAAFTEAMQSALVALELMLAAGEG